MYILYACTNNNYVCTKNYAVAKSMLNIPKIENFASIPMIFIEGGGGYPPKDLVTGCCTA